MFFNKLLDAIPFVFQAIVVVAVVILFAYFDPFNLFAPTKLKLKDTPVDVQSMRDIGQLITAEYYGEVVSSYAQQVWQTDSINVEELTLNIREIHTEFVRVVENLRLDYEDKALKKRDIISEYGNRMGNTLIVSTDYKRYIFYAYKKLDDKRYKPRHLNDELNSRKRDNMIENLISKKRVDEEFRLLNEPDFMNDLLTVYEQELNELSTKKLKNANLVMLGRGWVKAGFDFGRFTNDNFRYEKDRNALYFIGLEPKILSSTINPWFIPEKGVEGFEFLIVDRKVKRDYKVVQLVKQMCLDELIRKAHDREILIRAVENAKISMKEFFSLLLDEPIRNVEFYENEFAFTRSSVLEDSIISGEELELIDHLLRKNKFIGIDNARQAYLDTLKVGFLKEIKASGARIALGKDTLNTSWQPHLVMLYQIVKDGIFDMKSDSLRARHYACFYHAHRLFKNEFKWDPDQESYQTIKQNTEMVYTYEAQYLAENGRRLDSLLVGTSLEWEWILAKDSSKVGAIVPLDTAGYPFDELVGASGFQTLSTCSDR